MNATITPYSWIRKIPSRLKALDSIPLMGNPPPFPLKAFSEQMAKTFELSQFDIQISDFQWRSAEDLQKGLGKPLIPLSFTISPLPGTLIFVITEDALRKLFDAFLLKQIGKQLLDQEFAHSFYEFLALESIFTLNKLKYLENLNVQLNTSSELPENDMLAADITLSVPEVSVAGRLFITPELQQALREHYLKKSIQAPYTSPFSQQLDVVLHIEAGKTTISWGEWVKIKPGDFLILDSCTLKPGDDEGKVMLTLNGHPFFRGRIKQGNIKILEHPLYYEATQTMVKEEEDEDFEEEEEEETEEEEDEFENDEEEEDEEEEEEEEEDEEEEEEEEEQESEEAQTPPAIQPKSSKALSPNDIPLNVVVEVGRLQMTVQNLMDLKPGNLLELNVHPESGVELVVNGSCVAKGELIQVGELLGVRILEKG